MYVNKNWNDFLALIWKIDKSHKILWNFGQKNVIFRKIGRIFRLEKLCYLGNRVVREPCKWRTAYKIFFLQPLKLKAFSVLFFLYFLFPLSFPFFQVTCNICVGCYSYQRHIWGSTSIFEWQTGQQFNMQSL